MKKNLAIVAGLCIALSLGACGGSGKSEDAGDGAQEAAEQVQEAAPQVFDSDVATLEYRSTQDAVGNAVITFMLTNKTDRAIAAYAENVVVNGEFSIQAMGGAQNIAPGTSGAFNLTFGVPTQTTLAGVDDLTSISGDVKVYDENDVMNTLGYVHFDAVI